jgi:hypothetical protein
MKRSRKRIVAATGLAAIVALVVAALFVVPALATPPTTPGFSGATLAKGTYGRISSHVQTQDPQFWNEVIKTEGDSDLYVQQNTWDPTACGGCIPSTGWHTHPGPSLVIVTQGIVTEYEGDDPACTPHVYSAAGTNSFIDIGGGAVHIIRDESGSVAKTIAVQLIPAGAVRRQDVDAPDPDHCPF